MLRVAARRLIGSLTLSDQLCGCVGVVLTGRVEGTDFGLIKRCLETQKGFAVKHHPAPVSVVWICQHRYRSCAIGRSVRPSERERADRPSRETSWLCRRDVVICRAVDFLLRSTIYPYELNIAIILLFIHISIFIKWSNSIQIAVLFVCEDLTAAKSSRVEPTFPVTSLFQIIAVKYERVTGWGAPW